MIPADKAIKKINNFWVNVLFRINVKIPISEIRLVIIEAIIINPSIIDCIIPKYPIVQSNYYSQN